MSAPKKPWLKALILALVWSCLVLAAPLTAQEDEPLTIKDIRLSNYGGNNFVVSWRTSQPTTDNELLLGLSPGALTIVKPDTLVPPSVIHFARVTNADIAFLDTTYYYKVRSDGLEASESPVGYDSIFIRPQILVTQGAIVQGSVIDAKTRQPLRNVIVRSYFRWSRELETGPQVDSTMWYAVLTNADGNFSMNLANYRRYNGGAPLYVPGGTMMFLEIFGQSEGTVIDSVLLPFPRNEVPEIFVLSTYEIEDTRQTAKNGYIRATGPVLSNGVSASVVWVTVLDAENKALPNVSIRLQVTSENGVEIYQPQAPTDRFGRTWGLVYSTVSQPKTIRAVNISSTDTLDHVLLDSIATVEFIPELNAPIVRDSVAPFIYFTTELENTANTAGPYVVTARAVDNYRMKLDLLWSIQAESYEDTSRMTVTANRDEFTGNIPGQPFNTTVRYIVIAADSAGHRASKPDSVHSDPFQTPYVFDVLQDPGGEIPTLGITLTTDALNTTNLFQQTRINTWVTSDRELHAVEIKYRNVTASSTYFSIPMDNFGAHYWADIPAWPSGSRIEYFIQITDRKGETEQDRRNAPYSNPAYTYEVLSPGSLGSITFADTTAILGNTGVTLPSRASALADFNDDGFLDVAVANYGDLNKIYFYNKALGFEDKTSQVLGTQGRENTTHVAVADVNADDYLDLIFATDLGQNRLYINNTKGRMVDKTLELAGSATYLPADTWGTQCILPTDFDGDGDIDLYIVNSIPGGQGNRLLFNDGKGVFTDVTITKLSNEPSRQSVWGIVGDLDNDRRPDVVVINRADEHYWMRNEGNGVLRYRALSSGTSANARGGDLADVDGDGDLDLVVAQSDFTKNELYLNSGAGVFVRDNTGRLPAESDETYGVKFFDANVDGFPDLYYLNFGQPNRLLINDQTGRFQPARSGMMPTRSANSRHASVGDFNNDNRPDIYISEDQWANTVIFSQTIDPNSADLPLPFNLLAPGALDTVNTTSVSFIWNSSQSPDSTDLLVYNLQLSLDSQFSSDGLVTSVENLTDTTYTVSPLNDNTRYYWRVFVQGKSGYAVGSIQTNSFMLLTSHQGRGPEFYALINRNPAFAGHITAYIVASEPLLTNPTVTFNGQTVAAVAVSGNTIFRAHFVSRSSFLLTVSGRNLAGNIGQFSKTYSSSLASSSLASRAMTPDRLAWMEPAAGAADDGVRLLASTNEPVAGGALREAMTSLAGLAGLDLGSMAEVRSFTFTAIEGGIGAGARVFINGGGVDEPENMAICLLQERGWQPLPTIYDPETGIFSATVDTDGTYALLAFGPGSSQLPKATSFNLAQNSPNPFNPSTFITFTVPGDEPVENFTLKVYNLRGQVVKTLVNGMVGAGTHTVQWNGKADSGRDVPSGVYFYRLSAPGATMTRKMVLLR